AEINAQAQALITGEPTTFVPPRDLSHVTHERSVVRRAIELLEREIAKERAEEQRAALAARMEEWRRLIRDTAVCVIELRRLNRGRELFKREIGGNPSLPCNFPAHLLLGTGEIVGDPGYRFIREAIREGVITENEANG